MNEAGMTVLDARELGEYASWWAMTFDQIKQRLGVDMHRQTIEVAPRPNHTLGGLSTDEKGRVVLQSWSRWFTGVYAAGDACSSGLHGADVLEGNRLLEAICSGEQAGIHASNWVTKRKFTGASTLEESLNIAEAELSMLGAESDGPVQRLKPVVQRLSEILTTTQTPAVDANVLSNAAESLNLLSIRGEQLHCDETSLVANQNLLETLRAQAAIRLGLASVRSSELRTESRGLHQRSDFSEEDSEQLHHNLVYNDGSTGTLALRKGPSGNWILNPTTAV